MRNIMKLHITNTIYTKNPLPPTTKEGEFFSFNYYFVKKKYYIVLLYPFHKPLYSL